MKLNITPGPWTYTMPKYGKSRAKINGKNWSEFAKVVVVVDDKDCKQGHDNLIGIITAVQNTYHKGINPEAVPEMLTIITGITMLSSEGKVPDSVIQAAKTILQKATLCLTTS